MSKTSTYSRLRDLNFKFPYVSADRQLAMQSALIRFVPLSLMILTWVASAVILQGLQDNWSRPFALTYCVHVGYTLSFVPWYLLRRARLARNSPGPREFPLWYLLSGSFFLSVLASAVALCWYSSLSGTSVAGNSAVYQASSAFALIFSTFLLRERVTPIKVAAVAIALAGLALVAVGAPTGKGSRDTPIGYVWVTISAALYGFYEVAFARIFGFGSGGTVSQGRAGHPRPYSFGEKTCGGFKLNYADAFDPETAEEAAEAYSALKGEDDVVAVRTASAAAAASSSAVTLTPSDAAATTATTDIATASSSFDRSLSAAETSAGVLGLMGLWTLFTQWPIFFIAAAAQLEPLDLAPLTKAGGIALSMALDFFFNLFLLWGISSSTPFTMSLSTTLVVPATILTDYILHNTLPSPLSAGGTVLILFAVSLLLTPHDFATHMRFPRFLFSQYF